MSRAIALRLGQHFRKEDVVMVSLIVYCGKRVNALTTRAVGVASRFGEFLKKNYEMLKLMIQRELLKSHLIKKNKQVQWLDKNWGN